MPFDSKKITRVEVINYHLEEGCRAYTWRHISGPQPDVEISIQDDGRTLKIFISPKHSFTKGKS